MINSKFIRLMAVIRYTIQNKVASILARKVNIVSLQQIVKQKGVRLSYKGTFLSYCESFEFSPRN